MNRKEITKLLTDTLINTRLNDRKYYATEVTLDYGTAHPKRIDVMEFKPKGVVHVSDIEKGKFICYEIKSCKEDVYSGNGLNFFGEENYIVTTMETYKDLQDDIRSGKLHNYIREHHPESQTNFGFLVAIPEWIDARINKLIHSEYENPSLFTKDEKWKLYKMMPCIKQGRKRSLVELLFCMLRSGN